MLEVRLDAFPDGFAVPKKWPCPAIATARAPQEGGWNNFTLAQRQHLLESAFPWAAIIDVELDNAKKLHPLIARAHETQRSVILSYHNFQKTPSLAALKELASRAHDAGATVFKVATMTETEEELERLLTFQQLAHPLPIAAMGMGSLGKKSRPLLAAAGSALVYGWLYEPLPTMPESAQWSAKKLDQQIKNIENGPLST